MPADFRRRLGRFRETRRVAIAAACAFLSFVSVPASAQTGPGPLVGLEIAQAVAAGNTAHALALIEQALAVTEDYRLAVDLLEQKAGILATGKRHAEAAAALGELAGLIEQRDEPNSPALIPVLDKTAAEQEQAGQRQEAVATLGRLLELLRVLNLPERAEPYLTRLDALGAGEDEAAEQARSVADEMRMAMEETGRDFPMDPSKSFSTVKIYYATDRARTGEEDPNSFYGGDRGTLELGTATVSIPQRHLPGKIERPSIWTLEFREDPAKHVILKSVTPGNNEEIFAEMRGQLGESDADSAFVFIHGFNVPFNEAAQRTAQMAYDMNFDGLPILYSWPSRASTLAYIADTAVVNFSGRRLTLFLEDVVKKSGARRIHLIAHSMGNRALTDALELYALRHEGESPAFDQVLFTAPDLDAGLFAEMARTMRMAAQRLTLYASDKDWALAVSRKLHGDAARAGQGGKRIVHAADVDSIDMTTIGEDMLMHSYYANNPSALTDILSLFWRDVPPEDRCGMKRAEGEFGEYWEYIPEECDSNALLTTLSFLRKASIATADEARRFMNRFIVPATADPGERLRLEKTLTRLFSGG